MNTTARRTLAGGILAVGAAVVGRALAQGVAQGVRRRSKAIARVSPDLRSPLLWFPYSVRSRSDLEVLRAVVRRRRTRIAAGVRIERRTVPGIGGRPDVGVLVYEKDGRSTPSGALLWIHGGGKVAGSPEQCHATCSRFAGELGLLVVSVDYRLAPEHPFPAGLDDCHTVLAWMHDAAETLGIDQDRIAVGGESAGGGFAAALCQLARDRGGPAIAFQVLVYPMIDDRTAARSDHEDRGDFVWTAASNRFGWAAYLGTEPGGEAPPYAAAARCSDLSGLPPAWIGVGDLDLFHPEDVDYARRLEAAGVECELHEVAGMYHGADVLAPKAPSMRSFREAMTAALRSAMQAAPSEP